MILKIEIDTSGEAFQGQRRNNEIILQLNRVITQIMTSGDIDLILTDTGYKPCGTVTYE